MCMERTHKCVVEEEKRQGRYHVVVVNVPSTSHKTFYWLVLCQCQLKIGWLIYQSTHMLNYPKNHYDYITKSPWYNKKCSLSPKHKQFFIMLHDIGWNIIMGLDPNLYSVIIHKKIQLPFPLHDIYFFFPYVFLLLFYCTLWGNF